LFKRREFIFTYAKTEVLRQNLDSFFGQIWLLLNPLALSGVYFLLLFIINNSLTKNTYLHLIANLLVFYFISNCFTEGVKSVTNSSNLLLNSKFPRIVLPICGVLIAFYKFLPTLVIIALVKFAVGSAFSINTFYVLPLLLIFIVLGLAFSICVSLLNVYFRDMQNILPFAIRTGLYLSPILYEAATLSERVVLLKYINPLFPLLNSWSRVITHNQAPLLSDIIVALLWALGLLIIGSLSFISREDEFVVRI